jgi:NAD(P)-dependent dehydrogenase (short-subunit alcohol dehydrogenase family)
MDVGLAVVTGGAGGLGRLITQRLAEQGLCVVIADTDHAAATQLVTELHHRGRGAVVDPGSADPHEHRLAR